MFLAISETIAAVVNGTSSPPKRPRPISSSKKPSIISSTSQDDEKSIQSTISDLLDRCSSPSIENDIRLCLNDLCQHIVDQSITDIYNQLPSPVFKRKMETQILTKNDEQIEKKKPNRLTRKKSLTDNKTSLTDVTEKKDDTIEQELSDVKTMISTSMITNNFDYICEWENCRM